MSSREPLWYCHECNAEMRPLMVPDPVCASCHGSFVEKMDDPTDDPREFRTHGPIDDDGVPPGIDAFLLNLQNMMQRSHEGARPSSPMYQGGSGSGITFQIRGGTGGTRSFSIGRTPRPASSPGGIPTMSEYLGGDRDRTPDGGRGIAGTLMAQYIISLLGRDPFGGMFEMGGGGPHNGRMGDYVFNQEALDEIITQIMENSNAHRPVPATEEIMENLPREVLETGSLMLEKDCAVCKEQFKTGTEDPDEQIVVTLPCKHPFHQPCIIPWLKSSGTCPVCRHALVPQPEHHSPPPTSPGPSSGGSPRRSPRTEDMGNNFFTSFFGYQPGGSSTRGGQGPSGGSGPSSSGRSNRDNPHIPGRFPGLDDLD